MASAVKTRTVVQTRTHAQKYFQKVHKSGFGSGYSDDDFADSTGGHSSGGRASTGSGTRRTSKRQRRPTEPRRNVSATYSRHHHSDMEDLYDDDDAMEILSSQGSFASTPIVPKSGLKAFGSHLHSSGLGSGHMPEDFPQPSPAACGKRKEAELTAAKMLASHSASRDMEGANVLSTLKSSAYRPGEIVRRQRVNLPMLSIINPDSQGTPADGAAPGTPWEKEVRALGGQPGGAGGGGNTSNIAPLSVSTPSQQKDFLQKVRAFIDAGNVDDLKGTLDAAEASASSVFAPLPLKDIGDEPVTAMAPIAGGVSPRAAPGQATVFDAKAVAASGSIKPSGTPVKGEAMSPPRSANSAITGSAESRASTASAGSNTSSKSSNQSVVSRTLNRQGSTGTVLFQACQANFDQKTVLQLCQNLMEHGASPTIITPTGQTCLHVAALRGFERVGRLLLNRGCPVNAVGADGNAAIHIAMLAGHGHFIELLADFGANCHLRNAGSRAALDLAGTTVATQMNREELRRIMLSVEPRLRTLVLYHEDCLEHSARRVDDWEGPDRLVSIMHRLQNREEFAEHELEISSHFDKAPVEMLSRVHSPEYIAFVDKLSKKMQTEQGSGSRMDAVVPFTPQVQAGVQKAAFNDLKKDELCDTSFSAGTLQAARRAAGAVAFAVDRVLLGRNRNAFCCIRPPGHHAGYNGLLTNAKSCGFCIFNSVAAGALHALEGHNSEKVAIIDLDIHHGNGTEDIVRRYTNPSRLLFFSLHLYDKDLTPGYEFFPGSGAQDDSAHNIINVPILPMWHAKDQPDANDTSGSAASSSSSRSASATSSSACVTTTGGDNTATIPTASATAGTPPASQTSGAGSSASKSPGGSQQSGLGPLMGKEAYRQAIIQRLLPSLRAFNPDLILLSTGFDPALGDVGNKKTGSTNEIGMDLGTEDFEWVTSEIMKIADICCAGRVVSVLEGGYGSYPPRQMPSAIPPRRAGTRADSSPENAKPVLDRDLLAQSAASHVHRLVDTYSEISQHTNSLSSPTVVTSEEAATLDGTVKAE